MIGIEEPLRQEESNIINTASDAMKLAREVNHPNVKIIVDFYHLRKENSTRTLFGWRKKDIVHLHFANPTGRRWLRSAAEDPQYELLFIGERDRLSKAAFPLRSNGTFEEGRRCQLCNSSGEMLA